MLDFLFFVLFGRPMHWWEWFIIVFIVLGAIIYLTYWLVQRFGGMDP